MLDAGAPPQSPSRPRPGPALAGVLSLAAFSSLVFVPLVGAFLALLSALPLLQVVAAGRSSFVAWGWVAAVLAGVALATQHVWAAAALLAYLLIAVLPAVSVEFWLRRSWSTGRWAAGLTLIALPAAAGFVTAAFAPEPPHEALAVQVRAAVEETARAVSSFGGGLMSQELLLDAAELSAYLMPALAAMYVLSAALWLRPRLPLLGLPRGEQPFAFYASEEWLPIGFALGGLGWVFASGSVKWLATNVFVAVLGLYFLHGLAIIHFYLGRRLGTNRWVRVAVALFALQVPVALALSALGLADTFFRLRRGGAYDGGSEE